MQNNFFCKQKLLVLRTCLPPVIFSKTAIKLIRLEIPLKFIHYKFKWISLFTISCQETLENFRNDPRHRENSMVTWLTGWFIYLDLILMYVKLHTYTYTIHTLLTTWNHIWFLFCILKCRLLKAPATTIRKFDSFNPLELALKCHSPLGPLICHWARSNYLGVSYCFSF